MTHEFVCQMMMILLCPWDNAACFLMVVFNSGSKIDFIFSEVKIIIIIIQTWILKCLGYTYHMDLSIFFCIENTHTDVLSHTSLDLFPNFPASFFPPFSYLRGTVQAYHSGSQGNVFHLRLAQREIWGMMKMVWGLFLLILLDCLLVLFQILDTEFL